MKFYDNRGTTRLREEDVMFLIDKRDSVTEAEFQRYLNSVLMTDVKRNRRYTKALNVYEYVGGSFNGVVYASLIKRLGVFVPERQNREMVGSRIWGSFIKGLEFNMITEIDKYETRQVAAVMLGLGEIVRSGGKWREESSEVLERICEIVTGRVMRDRLVKKGNSMEIGEVVRGLGRIMGPDASGGALELVSSLCDNVNVWLGSDDKVARSRGVAMFLEGCMMMNLRPTEVCGWMQGEANWFVQDALRVRKVKNIVNVAVALANLNDERYNDDFFNLLDSTLLESLRNSIDFHDTCKLLWALTVKSSFRPEYSRVSVLWDKIIDDWGIEDKGRFVKTRKERIRKIDNVDGMAPHMQRNSTLRDGKRRFDVILSSTGARSSIVNPKPEEEGIVRESLALLGTAYAIAEVEGLYLDVAPPDLYETMERAKNNDEALIKKMENGVTQVKEDIKAQLDVMYGGPTYKSDIDPRMPGDKMWGSEGLSGVAGSKPGFLAIDLGNPAFKIAFEIADPNQMIWNAETKKKDGVNGRTAAKIRLLERYEWKVLVIDMQKWKLLGEGEGGKEAQKQFLFDTVTHKISV